MDDQVANPPLTDAELQDLANDPRTASSIAEVQASVSADDFAKLQALMSGGPGRLPLSGPSGLTKPTGPGTSPEDVLKMIISGGAQGLELAGGLLTGKMSLPIRTAVGMGTGALAGVANDEDPMQRAVYNGALEVVGDQMGKALPKGGYMAGQMSGNKWKRNAEDAGAFLRERARPGRPPVPNQTRLQTIIQQLKDPFQGLPLGAPKRTEGRWNAAGNVLEAENAKSPFTYDLDEFGPGNPELRKIHARELNSSAPTTRRTIHTDEANRFVEQQKAERPMNRQTYWQLHPVQGGPTPPPGGGPMPGGPQITVPFGFSNQGAPPTGGPGSVTSRVPVNATGIAGPGKISGLPGAPPQGQVGAGNTGLVPKRKTFYLGSQEMTPHGQGPPAVPNVPGQGAQTTMPAPGGGGGAPTGGSPTTLRMTPRHRWILNSREATLLKQRQRAEGQAVMDANLDKASKASIGADVELGGQNAAARADYIDDLQSRFEPGVADADARLSDLMAMRKTNEKLQGGGGFLSGLRNMASRGGLGTGVGMSLAGLFGGDISTGATVGGLTGLMASPSNVSRVGNTAGRLSENLPWIARIADTATDVLDPSNPDPYTDPDFNSVEKRDPKTHRRVPNVKRRKPKTQPK